MIELQGGLAFDAAEYGFEGKEDNAIRSCAAKLGIKNDAMLKQLSVALKGNMRKLQSDPANANMDDSDMFHKAMDNASKEIEEIIATYRIVRKNTEVKQNGIISKAVEVMRENNSVQLAYRFLANIIDYTGSGYSREGKASITQMEMAATGRAMDDIGLEQFKPNILGKKNEDAEKIIYALRGNKTDSDKANKAAQKWKEWSDGAVARLNKAYGAKVLQKTEEWLHPQMHPVESLIRIGKEKWKEAIKGVADPYGNEITDDVLDKIYDNILRGSAEPSRTPLMVQRRFMHFQSAEHWIAYHHAIGVDDVYSVLLNHIRGMEKRIALVSELGHDPARFISEALKQLGNSPSRSTANHKHLSSMLDVALGHTNQWATSENLVNMTKMQRHQESAWAYLPQVRGLLGRLALSSAVFSIPSEIGIHMIRAGFFKMQPTRQFIKALRTMKGGAEESRQRLARMGIFLDSAIHRAQSVNRYMGEGYELAMPTRLGNAFLEMTGFTFGIDMMKASWMTSLAEMITENLPREWADLDDGLKRMFESYGFGKDDWYRTKWHWDNNEKAKLKAKWGGIDTTFFNPRGISGELGLRWAGFLMKEGDLASGNNTALTDALISGGHMRGTAARELREWSAMFLRWPLTITLFNLLPAYRHIYKAGSKRERMEKLSHLAAAMVVMTTMGYMNYQIRRMIRGEEVDIPRDGKETREHMLSAIAYGGGFGLLGDMIFLPSSFTRGLSPIASLADSPGWRAMNDLRNASFSLASKGIDQFYAPEEEAVEDFNWKRLNRFAPHWAIEAAMANMMADKIYAVR